MLDRRATSRAARVVAMWSSPRRLLSYVPQRRSHGQSRQISAAIVGGAAVATMLFAHDKQLVECKKAKEHTKKKSLKEDVLAPWNHPKTEEQRKMVGEAIQKSRLLRHLDDEQKRIVVSLVVPMKFKAGDVILNSGEVRNRLYFVESGETTTYFNKTKRSKESYVVGRSFPGDVFGEQALIYHNARHCTIKAAKDTMCWTLDVPTLKIALAASSRLEKKFVPFATRNDDGVLVMTFDNFVRSLGLDPDSEIDDYYKTLFSLADYENRGELHFHEYAFFDLILSTPNPEYDIAFLLYDKRKIGAITLESVKQVLDLKLQHINLDFDFDCDLVKRFFGDEGTYILRFKEFCEFFYSLQEEIPRQAFHSLAVDGHVDSDQFLHVIQSIGAWRLPLKIRNRLHATCKERRGLFAEETVSYSKFMALNNVANLLGQILVLLDSAVENDSVSMTSFACLAKKELSILISPLEIDIIFSIFDLDGDGVISADNYYTVTAQNPEKTTWRETVKNAQEIAETVHQTTQSLTYQQIARDMAINFGLGWMAATAGVVSVYPMDLVKTRLQNQTAALPMNRLYRNSFSVLRHVVAHEGSIGLYRGITMQLMLAMPEKGFKLLVNDFLRSVVGVNGTDLPVEALVGAVTGASQVVFTNPFEIFKIRMQMHGEMFPGHKPSILDIGKELGVRGIYTGAAACFLRDIPFSAIYFPAFIWFKEFFARDGNGELTKTNILMSGMLAGVPAAWVTAPADMVKTRLQVQQGVFNPPYRGILNTLTRVLQEEGVTALWKGSTARIIRTSPQFGITLLVYEQLRQTLAPEVSLKPPTLVPVTSNDMVALKEEGVERKLSMSKSFFENYETNELAELHQQGKQEVEQADEGLDWDEGVSLGVESEVVRAEEEGGTHSPNSTEKLDEWVEVAPEDAVPGDDDDTAETLQDSTAAASQKH